MLFIFPMTAMVERSTASAAFVCPSCYSIMAPARMVATGLMMF